MRAKRYFWLAILNLVLTSCRSLVASDLPATYSATPFRVRVVDYDTGAPIAGVIVMAYWLLEGGIHTDRVGTLMILEAVTDEEGWVHFDGWGPLPRPRGTFLLNDDPSVA